MLTGSSCHHSRQPDHATRAQGQSVAFAVRILNSERPPRRTGLVRLVCDVMRLADGAANGDCLSYDSFSFDENGTAPAVALKGYDVLVEFLKTPSAAIDPVERIGDEV
jgi:hypothetical protein